MRLVNFAEPPFVVGAELSGDFANSILYQLVTQRARLSLLASHLYIWYINVSLETHSRFGNRYYRTAYRDVGQLASALGNYIPRNLHYNVLGAGASTLGSLVSKDLYNYFTSSGYPSSRPSRYYSSYSGPRFATRLAGAKYYHQQRRRQYKYDNRYQRYRNRYPRRYRITRRY